MAKRALFAIQVEVTSRCTRSCAVCPRSAFADSWLEGDLSAGLWQRLRPDLRLARHVHLQGWGEPLLHPELRTMVRDAHAAGCATGLTTNGDQLDRHAGWIIEERVGVLAVSVAGADARNRELRGGSATADLLRVMQDVAEARHRRRPRLHLTFLLTRDNAADLPGLIPDAAAAGVDRVLVNHLDCTPTAGLRDLAAWSASGIGASTSRHLDAAAAVARENRIDLRLPAAEKRAMLTCDLDPRRMISIRWDGRVAPCVMLNLPVDGPVPRVATGEAREVDAPVSGHLGEQRLSEILAGEGWNEWVEPFRQRMAADEDYRQWGLQASGWGVVGVRDLDRAWHKLERSLAANPFPRSCAGCPKADGW